MFKDKHEVKIGKGKERAHRVRVARPKIDGNGTAYRLPVQHLQDIDEVTLQV